jgi:hypothetical protein
MNLNMTEHGIDVNICYDEAKDFDNAEILSLVNRLVEALRGVEDVSISITSEYVIDADSEEVLEDMEAEYTDEEEEDSESDEEESDEEESEDDEESDDEEFHEEDQEDKR